MAKLSPTAAGLPLGTFSGFSVELRGNDAGTSSSSGHIAWITFTRPEHMNGMTVALKRDLIEVITRAQLDRRVRVVVFTGSGSSFCAGDDLKSYAKHDRTGSSASLMAPVEADHVSPLGTYDALRHVSQAVNVAIRNLDKLTIAAINGVAIQTGFSLALACDFRIAADCARMGSATLRFGLLPDEGGQYLLVQHMGVARTMDFLMHKRLVSAQKALELNLVHEVVPLAMLERRASEMANTLANGPQVAMRLLKRSIYNADELSFSQSLDEIASKTAVSDHAPDALEGVTAFREKRTPKFNSKL